MSERIRFHLDENVDLDVARGLRRHGIDVTTTQDSGLRTTQDADQLLFAQRTGRALVTHDSDFLSYARQSVDHPGIVYCQMQTRSVGEILRSLILLYEVYTVQEMVGRVEYI